MIGNRSQNQQLLALDLGTSSIKAVIIDFTDSNDQESYYVTAVGQAESRGIRKGVVINIDFTVENIASAIAQAEELALHKHESCVLNISGSHLEGINSHGIVKVKYNDISAADVDGVMEAAQAVPVPFDREVLHILPQDYVIDGQSGIQDPLGISAVRLESKVHLVTASSNSVQNMVKCVNRCGIEVKDIILSSLAAAQAVSSDDERAQGVCIIDIGAGTSDLCIYHNGALQHSAVLPIGGDLITKDLAAGLRIGVLSAEKVKCQYGVACPQSISSEKRVEVKSISNQVSKIISQNEVCSIIQCRLTEIFEMLKNEIDSTGYDHHLTAGIILTGGTANLEGICPLAEEVFALPVRVGTPQNLTGLSDFVNAPQFATVAGLSQYSEKSAESSMQLQQSSAFKKQYRKISNWISEHF